jgi:hypothetical protein
VLSVAGQAVQAAQEFAQPDETAIVRTRTASGTWLILHAATLDHSDRRQVAVGSANGGRHCHQ